MSFLSKHVSDRYLRELFRKDIKVLLKTANKSILHSKRFPDRFSRVYQDWPIDSLCVTSFLKLADKSR